MEMTSAVTTKHRARREPPVKEKTRRVTLLCRPRGRGRWRDFLIAIESPLLDMFTFKEGDAMDLGGTKVWIRRVQF